MNHWAAKEPFVVEVSFHADSKDYNTYILLIKLRNNYMRMDCTRSCSLKHKYISIVRNLNNYKKKPNV